MGEFFDPYLHLVEIIQGIKHDVDNFTDDKSTLSRNYTRY